MHSHKLTAAVKSVKLADIAREVNVRVSSDCTYPVYSVTKHRGFVRSDEYFKKQVFSHNIQGYKHVRRNQFAYATIHLDEGSIGLLSDCENAIISPMYTVFEAYSSEVCPQYLLRYLKSPPVVASYATLGRGSVHRRKAIPFERLQEITIPLPPLTEQWRVVTVLDKAGALREKRRQAINKLDTLLQAVFLDMFGDPVVNPKGWDVKKFSELGTLERGKSKHRPRNAPELLGGKYPLIQTGDVANANGYVRTYTQTYSEMGLQQSRMWQAGTLCITIAANIAKTAILTFDACFPDSLVGFTPNDLTTTEFIQHWMSFRQKELEETAPESAQKNINLKTLRELDVPLPPKAAQVKFTEMVIKIEALKERFREAAIRGDVLFHSLQQRAFNGNLLNGNVTATALPRKPVTISQPELFD